MMKQIVIRVDASTRMGIGHVMRCITLAKKLSENNCHITFLCKQHNGHINHFIESSGFKVIALSKPIRNIDNEPDEKYWLGCHFQDDANECIQKLVDDINIPRVDLLIIDHYSLDHQWQKKLSPYCKKIMVIDDLANRKHCCDILLDQTYGRIKEDYVPLIPKHCTLLLGKQYILLRDEFYHARSLAQKNRLNAKQNELNNILISLGGTDPDNIAGIILSWLISMKVDYSDLNVTLVANPSSSFLNELKMLTKNDPWVNIITSPPSMAKLMLNFDIAIGSSGTTAWERCCLGLPSLSIVNAENQQLVSKSLVNAGAIISLGCSKKLNQKIFEDTFTRLFNNKKYYQEMVQQSFNCCDGLGAGRVTKHVVQKISTIELKLATTKNKEITFEWQSDKNTRKYFEQPTAPTWSEHAHWFDHNLSNPNSSLYIIYYNKIPAGTLRLDKKKHDEYVISILIAPNLQGKGVALATLNKITQLKENGLFFASIHKDNINSIKVFKKAGFVSISSSQYYFNFIKRRILK
jgi:UDP-2,4-diacetamido-2,4,6-trideoxy-beta-L-altropyranose hydrolase